MKELTPEEMKQKSRGHSADMSPEAISRRLDRWASLYDLAVNLKKAKRVQK